MNILLTIVILIALAMLIVGGVVEAVRFLLWVGIALAVIAVIAWLLRSIRGANRG